MASRTVRVSRRRLEKIYKRFHLTTPTEVLEVDAEAAPDGTEEVLGIIGTLQGVAYQVIDSKSGKTGEPWFHEFDEIRPGKFRKNSHKPLLCYDSKGRLVIVGGKYKLTSCGIVG